MRVLGIWWSPWSKYEGLPHPFHLVDPDWDPAARAAVLARLRGGQPLRECLSKRPCSFCAARTGNTYLTDGTWVWPEILAHEVESHAVRLPAEFMVPQQVSADPREPFEDLTWWSQWATEAGASVAVDPGWSPIPGLVDEQLADSGHRNCVSLAWRTDGHDAVLCADDEGYRWIALRTGVAGPVSRTLADVRERFGRPPPRPRMSAAEVSAWADELSVRRGLREMVLWVPDAGAAELIEHLAARGYQVSSLGDGSVGAAGSWQSFARE